MSPAATNLINRFPVPQFPWQRENAIVSVHPDYDDAYGTKDQRVVADCYSNEYVAEFITALPDIHRALIEELKRANALDAELALIKAGRLPIGRTPAELWAALMDAGMPLPEDKQVLLALQERTSGTRVAAPWEQEDGEWVRRLYMVPDKYVHVYREDEHWVYDCWDDDFAITVSDCDSAKADADASLVAAGWRLL